MSASRVWFFVLLSVLRVDASHAEKTPLAAIFEGRLALSFKTVLEPEGPNSAWPGAVMTSGGQAAHRVVVDGGGGSFLIYQVEIQAGSRPDRFLLSILPPEPEAVRRYREFLSPEARQLNLPNYPSPQEIAIGDVVMFEILRDPSSDRRLIDTISVTEPGLNSAPSTTTAPRDFSLEDVEMKMSNYRLKIGDVETSSGGSCSGSILWFYLPNYGRFIFSPIEQVGYGFEKIGEIRDSRIVFPYAGAQIEWISSEPVLKPGTWSLWVRFEPDYRPPFEPGPGSALIGAADHVSYLVQPVANGKRR